MTGPIFMQTKMLTRTLPHLFLVFLLIFLSLIYIMVYMFWVYFVNKVNPSLFVRSIFKHVTVPFSITLVMHEWASLHIKLNIDSWNGTREQVWQSTLKIADLITFKFDIQETIWIQNNVRLDLLTIGLLSEMRCAFGLIWCGHHADSFSHISAPSRLCHNGFSLAVVLSHI